jgi:hypothetical protein
MISPRDDPMIASNLNLSVNPSRGGTRQPPEFPRLMAVLVIVLAVVNVSATLLMVGSWASMTDGMLELETSMQDHLIEIAD